MKPLQNLAQLFSRSGGKTAASEAVSPQTSTFELLFAPEHSLSRLYQLWSGANTASPLCLRLHPDALPPRFAGAEADTLRFSLTHLAERRLRQAFPKPELPPCPIDEYPVVHVTRDNMAAWLLLLPPINGGKSLSAADIRGTLQRRGVVYGLDEPTIDELPTLSQRFFQLIPIARGIPPVHGTDGRIVDHYPRQQEEEVRVDALEHADYLTLNLVHKISEGEVICEIIPPTEKTDGISVSGTPVKARTGLLPTIPMGRNTVLSEDGTKLLAARAGHVEFSGRTFQVKPVLELFDSVDGSQGDIHFLGDVHIHGDVSQGVTIRAMGNIQVDGVIGACTIEAGENLIVASGIQGQDSAVIRSHKSIYAKYLEHCNIYARDSVYADYIIGCNVFSNGVVKARTGRGVILGGTVRSAQEVSANIVGSKAECLTSIVLDGLPYNEFERAQLKDEVAGLEKELHQQEGLPVSPEREKSLSTLRLNLCVAKLKLDKFNKECQAQVLSSQASNDSRRLLCDMVYAGTEISIGDRSIRLSRTAEHCMFRLINDRIRQMSYQ